VDFWAGVAIVERPATRRDNELEWPFVRPAKREQLELIGAERHFHRRAGRERVQIGSGLRQLFPGRATAPREQQREDGDDYHEPCWTHITRLQRVSESVPIDRASGRHSAEAERSHVIRPRRSWSVPSAAATTVPVRDTGEALRRST